MSKIYLSKSNQSNPNLVAEVRQALKDTGHEVIEYQGGNYNAFIDGVFESTKGIVVISHPESLHGDKMDLGRGILSEITEAFKHDNKTYAYTTDHKLREVEEIHQYSDSELSKPKAWQLRYGYLDLGKTIEISNILKGDEAVNDLPDDLRREIL